MKIISCAALAAAAIALGVSGAHAGTASATLSVTASVASACSLSSNAVSFGNFAATTNAPTETYGYVNVNCSSGSVYTISLDNGKDFNGTLRQMDGSILGNKLAYNLCSDGYACNHPWGTGAANGVTGTGSGYNQSYPVYGTIAAGTYPSDTYSDTVNILLNF